MTILQEAMLKLKRCFTGFHGQFGRLHGFRSSILYSTSAASESGITNPLMVEYLVKSVGFSEDEAVSIATNCKVSHRFKSTKKSELVLNFLKDSGFNETNIRKLVIGHPMVFRSKLEENLKPKFRGLKELGFSGSDLGVIISQHPNLLHRSLEGHIVPALETLKSLIGSTEQLIRFLRKEKSPKLFSYHIVKNVPQNLLFLQSYGLPREQIKRILLRRGLILWRSTHSFEEILKGVEGTLGIPRTSGMFIHGICGLGGKTGPGLESWLQVFISYGWSRTEILNLLKRHPLALTVSVKEVRVRVKYFMKDLGYGSDYLIKYPVLLSYSMRKRIIPRTAVMKLLKEKQLLRRDISFASYVIMGESKFMDRFVLPFKDSLPQLYHYYTKTAGGSLSKA